MDRPNQHAEQGHEKVDSSHAFSEVHGVRQQEALTRGLNTKQDSAQSGSLDLSTPISSKSDTNHSGFPGQAGRDQTAPKTGDQSNPGSLKLNPDGSMSVAQKGNSDQLTPVEQQKVSQQLTSIQNQDVSAGKASGEAGTKAPGEKDQLSPQAAAAVSNGGTDARISGDGLSANLNSKTPFTGAPGSDLTKANSRPPEESPDKSTTPDNANPQAKPNFTFQRKPLSHEEIASLNASEAKFKPDHAADLSIMKLAPGQH